MSLPLPSPISSYTFIMQTIILVTLVSAAYSLPQIVPYVHEEIAAEPYIHQEVEAEPYVHIEPEISPLALGIVRPNAAPAAPQQFAAPVQQQQFVPQQQKLPQHGPEVATTTWEREFLADRSSKYGL